MMFSKLTREGKTLVPYYKLQIVAKIMSYMAKQKKLSVRFYVGNVDLGGLVVTTICGRGNGRDGQEAVSLRIKDAICTAQNRSDLDRFATIAMKEYSMMIAA